MSFEWVQGSFEWISLLLFIFSQIFSSHSNATVTTYGWILILLFDFLYAFEWFWQHSNGLIFIRMATFKWAYFHPNGFDLFEWPWFLDSLLYIQIELTSFGWVTGGLDIRMSAKIIRMTLPFTISSSFFLVLLTFIWIYSIMPQMNYLDYWSLPSIESWKQVFFWHFSSLNWLWINKIMTKFWYFWSSITPMVRPHFGIRLPHNLSEI